MNFLKNCDLILIDTMHDSYDFEIFNKAGGYFEHGTPKRNGEISKAANISRVGLSHFDPGYDGQRVAALLEEFKAIHTGAFVPREGEFIEL